MRTVRHLIYREVLSAVGFTTLAFLALMFFFDFVDQLGRIGRPGYTLTSALLSTLLRALSHHGAHWKHLCLVALGAIQ